ncbi:predicted esterase [Moesziomyces antarcticus T-34]|uniref:Predicted esterase n=1 Tax=Pseudozyma antarctica (strain T-34) TaxID=1151754 RepID=M9MBY1_PSEA3|nr:predicted esterase [Moesziomyces antarcticus T-34]
MSGTGFDTSFPHFSQDPVADASCNAPVLSQAFRSTDLKATSECVAPYNYIDPAKALGSQSVASFGQSIISPTQNLPSAPADTRYSSCDEDAEGEPDESFTAELSFWSTELGDTSGSTAATFAPAEASFPFVESCSALGAATLKRTAMQGDTPIELDLSCEADATAESSRYAPAELQPMAASTNMAKRSSGKKRRRSSPKRLTDYCTSNKASLYSAPAKNKAARSRTAASSSKAAANTRVADVSERQSPAMGSDSPGSGASGVSSPSTPSGKFKLRKKDEVPRRSLAALLTPPRDKRAGIFEDASQDARDCRKAVTPEPSLEVAADNGIAAGESAGLAHKSEADEMPEMVFADLEETEDVKPPTFVDKGQRIFPAGWEIHSGFPLLYQRYLVPSSVSPEVLEMLVRGLGDADYDDELRDTVDRAQSVHGAFNKPRSILELYTPRFVKGVGADKVGMCPVCYEEGQVRFFKTKFSAYNYHLQNFHGVSALTGLPFTPPAEFRVRAQPHAKPKERKQLIQGHCHGCELWIDMQGPKQTDLKVAEIYWWKHAQSCHRKACTPDGIAGYFVENQWFHRVHAVLDMIGGYDSEINKLLAGPK